VLIAGITVSAVEVVIFFLSLSRFTKCYYFH
jgi:hypothetical protein